MRAECGIDASILGFAGSGAAAGSLMGRIRPSVETWIVHHPTYAPTRPVRAPVGTIRDQDVPQAGVRMIPELELMPKRRVRYRSISDAGNPVAVLKLPAGFS
ncbi:hypothetical protein GCM10022295_49650 [Streptomyces osmaniensis]|uniref:Uncharacterized protein n=1 Tax=Streptomyces osmaniensis TaxID=593134 RepID=A0ABP6X4V2_9ACTN